MSRRMRSVSRASRSVRVSGARLDVGSWVGGRRVDVDEGGMVEFWGLGVREVVDCGNGGRGKCGMEKGEGREESLHRWSHSRGWWEGLR